MLRQASSRNQRSKGFKIKHALQICLLVAICVWLLYQVKHSHEKKRAFQERNLKMSKVGDSQVDFFKFGRKNLPQMEETGSVNETQTKEEENEETHEEEHDTKQEEIEDEEGRAAGSDEIDEQDLEKGDEEAGHGEEFTEEVDKDSHDEEDIHKEMDVFDNQDHEGGTQEAREENYKRDDASSAVVHDIHETESDTGTGGGGNTDEEQVIDKPDDDSSANGYKGDNDTRSDTSVGENLEKKAVQSENVSNGTDQGSKGDNGFRSVSGGAAVGNVSDTVTEAIQTDNVSSNVMAADNKVVGIEFSKPDNGSVSNSVIVEPNSQMELQTNRTTAAESGMQVEPQTNSTGVISDHLPETQDNSTVMVATGVSTSNDTASLDSAQDRNFAADNATVGEEDAHTSENVEQAENSGTTVVLDQEEHSPVLATEGESDNSSHPVITEEEKDARTGLPTLPEIQNEVKTTEDEAAE